MLDLEFLHGVWSCMSTLDKSVGMMTMDCLSRMDQVLLTAMQMGRGPTLSMRVIGLVPSHGQSATADTCFVFIMKRWLPAVATV